MVVHFSGKVIIMRHHYSISIFPEAAWQLHYAEPFMLATPSLSDVTLYATPHWPALVLKVTDIVIRTP